VIERGDAGDVFVQDVVLALLGGQSPQLLDCGVEMASRPPYGGIEHKTERAEQSGVCLVPIGPDR